MKKHITYILLVLVAALAASMIIAAYSPSDSILNILYRAGQIDKTFLARDGPSSSDSDEIIVKGENINVMYLEAETIAQKHSLMGSGGLDEAIEYLVRRETLYYHAQQNGFSASEHEIQDMIDVQKNASKKAANLSEFEQYLKGLGMSVDEYWDSQYENLKKDIVIGKYIERERSNFAQRNGLLDMNSPESIELWKTEYDALCNKLIKAENIKRNH